MSFPAITGLSARYFGAAGGATNSSYFVQAIYPGGRSPIAGPATVVTPAAMSNDNKVLVVWEPSPGAIGYDILKNLTGTTPTGVVTAALEVRRSVNSVTDIGQTLVSYTVGDDGGETTLATATDTATLLAASVLGNPAVLTGTPTAAAAYTLPTATLLIAAMSNPVANGTNYRLIVKNTSAGAFTITMTAGVGVTITGTATIAQNNFREFLIIPTNLAVPAVTLLAVSSGAF